MRVFVKFSSHRTSVLCVEPDFSIENVKRMIHAKEGIPPAQQRLLFAGRQIDGDHSLADFQIRDESTLEVLLRLRGGVAKTDDSDFYTVLGVSFLCGSRDLKIAYRQLAVKYHPDKQLGKSDAEKTKCEETFKRIAEAYDVLSNPRQRFVYDRFGRQGLTASSLMEQHISSRRRKESTASMHEEVGGVSHWERRHHATAETGFSAHHENEMERDQTKRMYSRCFDGKDSYRNRNRTHSPCGADSDAPPSPPQKPPPLHRSTASMEGKRLRDLKRPRSSKENDQSPCVYSERFMSRCDVQAVGAIVQVSGLRDQMHLNGVRTRIEAWDDGACRYTVPIPEIKVEGNGTALAPVTTERSVALRPRNLLSVVAGGMVTGLTSDSWLNGVFAESATFDRHSGKYRTVTVDGRTVGLSPGNLMLPRGTLVSIDHARGEANPQLVGRRGTVICVDVPVERYVVQFPGNDRLSLRFDAVSATC